MSKVEKVVREMCFSHSLDSKKFPNSFYDKLNDAERAEAIKLYRQRTVDGKKGARVNERD